MARQKSKRVTPKKPSPLPESKTQLAAAPQPFPVVGIGASAGGFEAFADLLRHLPEQPDMAFVLVQHLDPTHGSMLSDILSRTVNIPVSEVTDGVRVEKGHVYVIPANTDMEIQGGELRLSARIMTRSQHMPIDHFFQSLAEERGHRAIGIILSGTASDGTEGCRAIKAAGGITFAQDEQSAKFSGMPRSAVASGCIDFVMKPSAIAKELVRIVRHPYLIAAQPEEEAAGTGLAPGRDMDELMRMVADASGVDFSHYKQTTLHRRIQRRMVAHRLEKLADYVAFIKANPVELDELYRDILIHVTGFFRDPGAFEALRATVLPAILKDRHLDDTPVRIWVPGCSTGEEVYSIAMVLIEYLWERQQSFPLASIGSRAVQIFATDISDNALDRARAGLYGEAAVAEVSPARLAKFFLKIDGGYQINKALRDMCIFAKQNVTRDPPFSNLDLISCRNLLIYLGPTLQKRVIPTLHCALKTDGYLMLGGSESLGTFTDHFTLIDKKQRIYQKKKNSARLINYFAESAHFPARPHELPLAKAIPAGPSIEKEVERLLLSRYMPASIVVNEQMEVVHIRGRVGSYLEIAEGYPTASLAKMAREGLLVDLHSTFKKAKRTNAPARAEGVHVKANGTTKEVNLTVTPVPFEGVSGKFFMVIFHEVLHRHLAADRRSFKLAKVSKSAEREMERLRHENTDLKQQLRSLLEEHETTTEEFKSVNEEVLSANEELQSTNEELETAKEELQSGNEELNTLNEELHNRNIELTHANNDLVNLLANINLALVMVGSDLSIRRFTPPAEKLLNLISADVGRRIGEVRPNLEFDDLEKLVKEVVDNAIVQQQEVKGKDGKWYQLRVRPYKTWDNKIEGAVLSLQDVDIFKRTLEQTRAHASALIESARESILILDDELRITGANDSFYRFFALSRAETEGKFLYELGDGHWDIPELRAQLSKITQQNTRVDNFHVQRGFHQLGTRSLVFNARRIQPEAGTLLILLTIEDVTDREEHLSAINTQSALLEMAHETVIVRDLDGTIRFWNRGAEQTYGWTKEEVVGKLKQDLLRPEFPKPFEEIRKELLATGYWEGEVVHVRKDGQRRFVKTRWAVRTQPSDKPIVLEINTDITERKRNEANLRQLSTYLMRVQDEERRKIARDLHDSAGQSLAALKIQLDKLRKSLETGSEEEKLALDALSIADETLSGIRNLAHMLHPPLLDEVGLISAIRWLVDEFPHDGKIKVDLKLDTNEHRFPQGVEIALFRVAQEALNNIYRHSGATRARVDLQHRDGDVVLRVTDNGRGMPEELLSSLPASKARIESGRRVGVGILGMKERLAELGGRLEITSGEKGTTITAVVPASTLGSFAELEPSKQGAK